MAQKWFIASEGLAHTESVIMRSCLEVQRTENRFVSKLLFTHIKQQQKCSSFYFACFTIGRGQSPGVLAPFQSFLWAREEHIFTIPLLQAQELNAIVCLPQLSHPKPPITPSRRFLLLETFATVLTSYGATAPELWRPFHTHFKHLKTHWKLIL